VRIGAETLPGGDRVRLVVEDSGRGIPPDVLPHVFEPFFTTKQEGVGVGLGLAIVYGIVQRHHGHIDVTSKPGTGARFTIELPTRQPATATAAPAAEGGTA
jgi:two-component system cell cycle sensor histidine kinase/response regulator CckA